MTAAEQFQVSPDAAARGAPTDKRWADRYRFQGVASMADRSSPDYSGARTTTARTA
ncbi:hypothetical protein IU427_17785 [Nocardia beijingensis]|nr:hypothetical protein [Nocardia beijingensis]MBF6467018.1 hypothetical protein [Nocardia beijingensis]